MFKHSLSLRQVGFRRGLESELPRGLKVQEFARGCRACFRSTGECCFDLEALELTTGLRT